MKKALKWIFVGLLAIAVVGVFVYLWQQSRPKPKTFATVEVTRGDLRRTTIVTGDIEPRNEVAIKPQINGTIAELYKQPGEQVIAGEPIAKLRVITDAASLSSAESQVRVAEHNLTVYRDIYLRDSVLLQQGVVAKEDYEKSYLQYVQGIESLQAAKDNLDIIREGSTKNKGNEQITNTIVRSTVSGTILDIPVKVGNTVMQISNFNEGTTIASVANMRDLLFVGKIDETEVGKLKEGMPMELVVGALQDSRFAATLEYIAPKGTSNNGAMMFEIKGAVTLPDSVFIRSGYSANAEIILEEHCNVLLIPEYTMQMTDGKNIVQILSDTAIMTYEPREIQVGLSDGMQIEVIDGLKEGEKLQGNEIN